MPVTDRGDSYDPCGPKVRPPGAGNGTTSPAGSGSEKSSNFDGWGGSFASATRTGQEPEQVLSNVIRGRHPLLSVAPLAGAPIAAGAFSRSPQQDTNPPGGGR